MHPTPLRRPARAAPPLIFSLSLLGALLAGCDDGGVAQAPDVDPVVNPPARDSGSDFGGGIDVLIIDAAPEIDAAPLGGFGVACQRGEECLSGYCVPNPQGLRVCTEACFEDCPDQWECRPVNNTHPDTVFICVAERHVQCLPCEHDGHCGSGDDRCITIGQGLYCARDCSTEVCPEGHSCQAQEIDGEALSLCVPDEGTCRPCIDGDGDGYGDGEECLGFDCDDEDVTVHQGAVEVCDGRDNDCNALTDDAVIAPEGTLCNQVGVCEGTAPACVRGAWVCDFGALYTEGADLLCDGLDNDCDGQVDEDIDTLTDVAHCGGCGQACDLAQAEAVCEEGVCNISTCQEGFYDLNEDDEDGCEYRCSVSNGGVEQCDGIDNDCNGVVDEGFDLQGDPDHCGGCEQACDLDFADAICVEGVCAISACDALHRDRDGIDLNGCECALSNDGVEACDGLDNDCDGEIDEDFDLQIDPLNCGQCQQVCTFAFAQAACLDAGCVMVGCAPEYWDLDGDATNGCEYACVITLEGQESCDGIDNDCDGVVDEDFDLLADVDHCGACGARCVAPHASSRCDAGICAMGECEAGFYDLNEDEEDGCEYECTPHEFGVELCNGVDDDCDGEIDEDFDLAVDVSNCGQCQRTCAYANGVPECVDGLCGLQACEDTFWDVNRDLNDGCEYRCLLTHEGIEACDEIDNDCDGAIDEAFNLDNDALNCGHCGVACAFPNSAPRCVGGLCEIAACLEGFYNHDGDPINGCEYACLITGEEICDEADNDCDGQIDEGFDLNTRVDHCGACDQACAPANATGRCVEGACEVDRCAAGFLDLNRDPEDGCEYACVPDGDEVCDTTDNDCDGAIDEGFDLQSDLLHCGDCATACAYARADALCDRGRCQMGACDDNWYDLNGDPSDGCEYPCAITVGGEEVCDTIDNDCDGQIDEGFDLLTDEAHCGDCDTACAFYGGIAECQVGACALIGCRPGFHDLNGDPSDGCEFGCQFTGAEVCDGEDNNCDGQVDEAFDLQTDANNCGQCGRVCAFEHGAAACVAGGCVLTGCDAGFVDLNRLSQDGCEYACVPQGVELCNEADDDCDGAIDELYNLLNDTQNCGACDNVCAFDHATPRCLGGICQIEACHANFWDINGDPSDGCEYPCQPSGLEICDGADNDCDGATDEGFDLQTSEAHCGACNAACALNHASPICLGGVCQIDDCDAGYVDLDGLAGNGCEYACVLSNDGVERCDARDNDCDGEIDEDFDLGVDQDNCGACGISCRRDFAQTACEGGACQYLGCEAGHWDLDGQQANGCEYACDLISAEDLPDLEQIDANCDGIDGDLARAVFVSANGDDDWAGTRSEPVRTIGRGLSLAQSEGKDQVLIAQGTYAEMIVLRAGIGVYGGYDHTQAWRRDPVNDVTRVEGRNFAIWGLGVAAETRVQGMTLVGAESASAGGSSYAVWLANGSDGVILEGNVIIGGRGRDGASGAAGKPGADG
ncbi:DUF1565 domain-containing protein, partial [Myxococcota bacterium]|nr:DUF1565 domain-containing protein [Myxococcota bacterium]